MSKLRPMTDDDMVEGAEILLDFGNGLQLYRMKSVERDGDITRATVTPAAVDEFHDLYWPTIHTCRGPETRLTDERPIPKPCPSTRATPALPRSTRPW